MSAAEVSGTRVGEQGTVAAKPARKRGWRGESLTRAEWTRLGGFAGGVLFLHLLGWGLFLYYARTNPALAGLGSLAYTFGLRHAFDADHIAAIDNTTRKLLRTASARWASAFFFARPLDDRLLARGGSAVAASTVNSKIPGSRRSAGTSARPSPARS
jgi:hypothetical protein